MSKIYVGIDPGKSGAIAILDGGGNIVDVHDMPTIELTVGKSKRHRFSSYGFRDLIKRIGKIEMVFVERVNGMKGDGGGVAFTFGYCCGGIEGVLVTLDLPMTFIMPQKWKKAFALTTDKGLSRQRAMQLWPADSERFARVKDDGRAEAALLARFGLERGL